MSQVKELTPLAFWASVIAIGKARTALLEAKTYVDPSYKPELKDEMSTLSALLQELCGTDNCKRSVTYTFRVDDAPYREFHG